MISDVLNEQLIHDYLQMFITYLHTGRHLQVRHIDGITGMLYIDGIMFELRIGGDFGGRIEFG